MTLTSKRPLDAAQAYARIRERAVARDQAGASDAYYALAAAGRPATELAGELVRSHAPYTHVPYHQRLDDGVVRFVNNDHCLLSARASLRLTAEVSPELRYLPLAQTLWYIPTGLDPWNQLIGRAPGHYARMYAIAPGAAPAAPQVHWPDQEPEYLEGSFDEKLNEWLTLVQRGEVLRQYRVFLGLLQDVPNRRRLLAHLVFAGLIDVQDRMLYNRSYTTGHKSFRARATVELGETLGWDQAHHVVYAGVPDLAVGPRWHSTYEMACQIAYLEFEGRDAEFRHNTAGFTDDEVEQTFRVLMTAHEPAWQHQVSALLQAGKSPIAIVDVLQTISARIILETHDINGFSMPQHCYEYLNTLRWFLGAFDHPHQVKLLYVAAGFVNRAAHHQAAYADNGPKRLHAPRGAAAWPAPRLLEAIEAAILALDADTAVALTGAYLRTGDGRDALLRTLADASTKLGNDPHNQELGMCLIEDYRHSMAPGRDTLLLAAAKHTANHRKYGNPLEAYQRFADAMGIVTAGA